MFKKCSNTLLIVFDGECVVNNLLYADVLPCNRKWFSCSYCCDPIKVFNVWQQYNSLWHRLRLSVLTYDAQGPRCISNDTSLYLIRLYYSSMCVCMCVCVCSCRARLSSIVCYNSPSLVIWQCYECRPALSVNSLECRWCRQEEEET